MINTPHRRLFSMLFSMLSSMLFSMGHLPAILAIACGLPASIAIGAEQPSVKRESSTLPAAEQPAAAPLPRAVLIFSKTAGFRHDSIPEGIAAFRTLASLNTLTVEATEDSSAFTDENLSRFGAVVFLNTTGDVLDPDQQGAFERFIRQGRGFVGVHSASDTEYKWPWFGGLVGAYFAGHPKIQPATLDVLDRTHPSTAHLPAVWQRTDEWYDFNVNPRPNVHVLMTIDERTYEGGKNGWDHPMAWCHLYDGGRAWYTAGGHTKESFSEDLFVKHLEGGLLWTLRIKDSDPPFRAMRLTPARVVPGPEQFLPWRKDESAAALPVAFAWPPQGGVAGVGDVVKFRVSCSGPARIGEGADGPSVGVQAFSGHDFLASLEKSTAGRGSVSGERSIAANPSIASDADTFKLLRAVRGLGPGGVSTQVLLQPRRKQAEHFTAQQGCVIERVDRAEPGTAALAFIESGDFAAYSPYNLHGVTSMKFRVASASSGGTIEIRADAPDGTLIGKADVPNTGGWQSWKDVSATISDPGGTRTLFLVFKGGSGSLFNINWFECLGPGVTGEPPVK
jgi:type 1 glutamine amidotransferase